MVDALPSVRLDVYVPFPDQDRMLLLSFSTPIADLADPMLTLFAAMAESVRWTRETP